MINKVLFFIAVVSLLYSCSAAEGNNTGHEYMPDMAHAVAYEANVYDDYSLITWDKNSAKKRLELSMPKHGPKGTVPRGYLNENIEERVAVPLNGYIPFEYANTEDDRLRASNEILNNPYPITDQSLAQGKELFEIYCAICHGPKGDGNGYLVRDDGGKFPAQPVDFTTDNYISSSNGLYYFTIMHGKNVMGSFSDKLSYKERWEVIHYIRSLQAKKNGSKYDSKMNTLNKYAIPAAQYHEESMHHDMDMTMDSMSEDHSMMEEKAEH